MTYALTRFVWHGATPPFTCEGVRVSPATSKSGYAISARGSVPHRVEALAVTYRGGVAQFAARWMCGNGSKRVVPLADIDQYEALCRLCETAQTSVVYRCYGANGDLLYVGCTDNYNKRRAAHEGASPWWHSVADVRIEEFPTTLDALRAERQAIRSEAPKFNRAHRATRSA